MPPRSKALVLDTGSVVAYFEDEPSGEHVADLIADAQEGGASLAMSVVNAGGSLVPHRAPLVRA